jgi:hypothetical protein
MNRFSPALLALFLLALPSVLEARIGETLEQCIARYGPPDKGPQDSALHPAATDCGFVKDGLYVVVTVYQGKAVDIMFRKLDGTPFNASEVKELLTANGGTSWMVRKVEESDKLEWATKDGTKLAMLGPNRNAEIGRVLTVWTNEWQRTLEEQEKSDAKKKLKGF